MNKGDKYKSSVGDVAVVIELRGDLVCYDMAGVAYEGPGPHHFQPTEDFVVDFPDAA
jgi:hypothetical protein